MGFDDEARMVAQRTEARFIAISIAIAGSLGYLWLSNTWAELQRMRDELVSYRTSAEATYAQKEMVRMIDERFSRVEKRLEERLHGIEEFHQRVIDKAVPDKGQMK